MAFESGIVSEDWRFAVIVLLYKGKGERTECKNYRSISLLRVVGRIYEEEGFRMGRVCVDQIFTLKQMGEKA